MPTSVRKLGLTLHVVSSIGWLGAVAAFLALAGAGLTSFDAMTVRSSYVAMNVVARSVILPLCLASLATGIFQSLTTRWGLIQHYWVLLKLGLTVLATLVLLMHLQPIADLAVAAAVRPLLPADLRFLRLQVSLDAGAAFLVLIVSTVLAVYKPRGVTGYGWRKQQVARSAAFGTAGTTQPDTHAGGTAAT